MLSFESVAMNPRLIEQGSSQKDRDRRQKLQEQKEEQIREATQVFKVRENEKQTKVYASF